jgi:hypothetical protein
MTRDDIIRMAREAGLRSAVILHLYGGKEGALCDSEIEELAQIERLFHMAQAAERNKVAQWMIAKGYATGHGDTVEDLLQELEWQIAENWTRGMVNGVQAEREACAKVCDRMAARCNDMRAAALESAAENIRARGQA